MLFVKRSKISKEYGILMLFTFSFRPLQLIDKDWNSEI